MRAQEYRLGSFAWLQTHLQGANSAPALGTRNKSFQQELNVREQHKIVDGQR